MTVFSVPIFFIVFRETLEAAIIVSVLLGLVEQIVRDDNASSGRLFVTDWKHPTHFTDDQQQQQQQQDPEDSEQVSAARLKALIRRLRIQIFLGAALGLFIALAIGAAFIAVWFTQASNLWSKSEELWEGIFSLIAALIILVMGVTMLKLDRAKAKWRVKLTRAFERERSKGDTEGKAGRWILFLLPLITVLREGMEAVIFVGGVALGQSARSIPIAAIVGFICGIICGILIYAFASRSTITTFLVVMTNFILLIGAGLFSKAVWDFEENHFNNLLGADVDDAGGDGPGSYNVRGSVWHLDCCNPEDNIDGQGWSIFNALFGWTNSANLGSVLSYVFYWLLAIAVLVYLKYKEGRTKVLGFTSAEGVRRAERKARKAQEQEALENSEGLGSASAGEKEGSYEENDGEGVGRVGKEGSASASQVDELPR